MLRAVKFVSKQMRQTLCYHPKAMHQMKDNSPITAEDNGLVAPRSGADSTNMKYCSLEEDNDSGKISFEPEEEFSDAPNVPLYRIATFSTGDASDSTDTISILTDDDGDGNYLLDEEVLSTTTIDLHIFDETTLPELSSNCTVKESLTHYVPQIDAWEVEHYGLMIIPSS